MHQLAELSPTSAVYLEFGIRAHSRTRTLLWASLTLHSPAAWDGIVPSSVTLGVSQSFLPHPRDVEAVHAADTPNTTFVLALRDGVVSWTREVSATVRGKLQASSTHSTAPTAPSRAEWDWPVMPRYRDTDGRDVMRLMLTWTSSTSSSYIQLASERHRDRAWFPKMTVYDTAVSGTLPTELGELVNLGVELGLRGNYLTGTVPTQLTRLQSAMCVLINSQSPFSVESNTNV